jgi:hypothetical protein
MEYPRSLSPIEAHIPYKPGQDIVASRIAETLTLAGENAAVVGDVEREECQKVARVANSLDA